MPQADGYWHVTAQNLSDERRHKQRKLVQLRNAVIEQLKEGWSPEQIAGRLSIEPNASQRLCHETVYQYVYSTDGRRNNWQLLPERRRKRKPRHARKPRGPVFPATMAIKHRPDEINDCSQFGNWEGDSMIFRREHGNANIATLVERNIRYTVLLRNNDRKSRPITNQFIHVLSPLPQPARRGITFDRGFEFTSWRELDRGMGTKSWFCDPQAPWQRGTVENTNKRVRRYLPPDTVLLSLPNRYVSSICARLNATTRRCLGWRTPAEAFQDELLEM